MRIHLHYNKATLFKPNLKELKEGLKLDFDGKLIDDVKEGVTLLKEKLAVKIAFITLSENGVYIDAGSDEKHHISAHKREIADVSGAGDTVISVAALSLAMGLPADLIAGLSNLAGGIVCEYVGVVPINKEDLYTEAQRIGLA
jgi:bifunctional ADP-heptose synthase (sugar kinase/adenylyltransferase)